MAEVTIFIYLQPLTYLIFALGFGFIRYYVRGLSAAGYFAFAFVFGTLASMLEISRDNIGSPTVSYLILGTYTATACLMTIGNFSRVNEQAPVKLLAGLVAGLLVFHVVFWEMYDSIVLRTFVANLFNAVILGLPLIFLRNRRHILIDKILFWLLLAIVVQIALRVLVTLYLDWSVLTVANYPTSIVGLSFRFTTALAAIALAVTLYVALGIDIVYVLKQQSITDKMTGLRNRAGFEDKARRIMEQAIENRTPVCLLITDLDRFKQVNDSLGHATGDVVIGFFGRILGNMARKTDVAGRVGGEEFCVLLNDCVAHDAVDLAEAVRHAFCQTPVPGIEPELKCSASFGIAVMRGDERFSDLYKRADEALYRAKNEGRNRVVAIDNYNWRPAVEAPPLQPELSRRTGDRVAG